MKKKVDTITKRVNKCLVKLRKHTDMADKRYAEVVATGQFDLEFYFEGYLDAIVYALNQVQKIRKLG
jgi:hypothetical protein